MSIARTFRCGHPRTNDNMRRNGKSSILCCRICRQEQARECMRRKLGFYDRHHDYTPPRKHKLGVRT